MRSTYMNVLFRFTVALIFAMFLKATIVTVATPDTNGYETYEPVFPSIASLNRDITLKVKEVFYGNEEDNLKKPYFSNKNLDKLIDSYIESNSCEILNYNHYELGNNRVNVFLNCGTPKNIIYDYKNNKELSFDDITSDKNAFLEKSKSLLKLKYPTFVVDDINFDNAVYDIKSNEIKGYYMSPEYGEATYSINNNEIKNLFNYDMSFDESYENEVFKLDPNKKTIAFTYDDGPSTYDLELIDLLTNSHSTATFFLVGNRINNYPTAINKLAESNMEVGNHTYSHKSLTKLSSEKLLEEINRTTNLYLEKTGKNMTLLRPSYGAVNKKVLVQVGMPVILWNIDTLDWKTRNADKVYEEIMSNAKDGDIVLMHSLYKTTVEATDRAIKSLYKEGFQIVSVGELAKLKGRTLNAGSSYLSLK